MYIVALVCIAISLLGFFLGRKSSETNSQIQFIDLLVLAGVGSSIMYGGKNWYDDTLILGFLLGFREKNFTLKKSQISVNHILFLYLVFEVFNGLHFFLRVDSPSNQLLLWLGFFALLIIISISKIEFSFTNSITNPINIRIIFGLLIFYLICSLFAIVKFGTTAEIQFAQNPASGFSLAIWPNTAYITISMILFIFILMIHLIKLGPKSQLYLALISLILIGFLCAVSLSRSAVLLSFAILLSFLFKRQQFLRIKYWKIFILFSISVMAGAYFSESALTDFGKDLGKIELQTDRKEQYVRSMEWIRNGTISEQMFGNGWRTSGISLAKGKEANYAASFVPILPIEIGLLGTGLLFVAIFSKFIRTIRENWEFRFQYAILLISILATGAIVNYQTSLLFWLFLI